MGIIDRGRFYLEKAFDTIGKFVLRYRYGTRKVKIDEEMREKGILRLEEMFDRVERNILEERYRVCKKRGHHEWYEYRKREICRSCWRDFSTKDEEPTPEDTRRGLMKARERFNLGLKYTKSDL